MNHSTRRSRTDTYFPFLVFGICLVSLLVGTLKAEGGEQEAVGRTQKAESRDHASEVRDQKSEVGSQKSEVPASPLPRVPVSVLPLLLPPAPASSKISPQVLEETAGGKRASVVILLADQADVSAAYEMKDQDARGWYVYNTLSKHAARTQAALKSSLKARGIAYQSFWVANMIVASVDRTTVESLAARADVARIDSNRPSRWIEDPEIATFGDATDTPKAPDAISWGVTNVNAPPVWDLGFKGNGIVIANQDTGTRWTHNALKLKYRGWNGLSADHNYNWHDAIHSQIPGSPAVNQCGRNLSEPCDDQGHGTHTTGTTSGDDGLGNQVGVAPSARWIGCRNMDQGNGTPATYSECFQFFIAPTDLNNANANPSLRPHVMNNSWGCPPSEGCSAAALETIVNNTQASGIFVVVSAGNAGSGCSTVADPPAIYNASFSVGAYDIGNNLAGFSSRGPSTFYNPNLLKPNISAPGVNVFSSTRTSDSSFSSAGFSGTSMAGPHVVGVVALLWSARPALVRNIAATKALLQNTANPAVTVALQTCGGTPSTQIPNNSFGYGRVDALAAVSSAPSIFGRVNYLDGVTPAKNVTLTLTGNNGFVTRQTTTDGNGDYAFPNVPAGNNYTVTPTKTGDVNGIESLDAANTARFIAGLDIPTANQEIAADADGDGLLTSLDASYIARRAAGLPDTAIVGTWKFAAPNRTYTSLSADQANQNFSAILVGDTGGNWVPANPAEIRDQRSEVRRQ